MDIRVIMLSLLEVDLQKLNRTVRELFAELQAKYNNDTDHLEKCKNFMQVLEICKAVSLRADAIQEMCKASELFDAFLEDEGIDMGDLENGGN